MQMHILIDYDHQLVETDIIYIMNWRDNMAH